jgi:hypothetical protein
MDEVSKPKHHKAIWISAALIIIAAAIAGGGTYYWQHRVVNNTKSSDQSQIGSLNSKISSLTGQLSAANAKIKTLSQPVTPPAAPTVSDQTAITNVVTADCEAEVGYQVSNISITTLAPPYASVGLACLKRGEVGGILDRILEKVGDQWVIIDRPTNGIDAATRQNYGIPDSIQ